MERQTLRALAAEVLGIPVQDTPRQLIFTCNEADVARAVTLRNAVHVLSRFVRGEAVCRSDSPWHRQYIGRSEDLIKELLRSGYLNATQH